jgi:hypothetical protein
LNRDDEVTTKRHSDRRTGDAIVSEDGMLANAARIVPDALNFKADQHVFEYGLDGVDVVVDGRYSPRQQRRLHLRRRLILSRMISAIALHASNQNTPLLWNAAGVPFEDALFALGMPGAKVGIIGRTGVFLLFLVVTMLALVVGTRCTAAGGCPVFPKVPTRTPGEVLERTVLAPTGARSSTPPKASQ